MEQFESEPRAEKIEITGLIVESVQSLADEQGFDVTVDVGKGRVDFNMMSNPNEKLSTGTFPTHDEIETFKNVAITRMHDLFPDYNWPEGVWTEIETLGNFSIIFDEDKLGIE